MLRSQAILSDAQYTELAVNDFALNMSTPASLMNIQCLSGLSNYSEVLTSQVQQQLLNLAVEEVVHICYQTIHHDGDFSAPPSLHNKVPWKM